MEWIEEYKNKLIHKEIPYSEVYDFVKSHLPRKIYRYRKFDDFWENNLFDGDIYFSQSSNLNDPFDCLTYVDEKIYSKNIKDTLIHMLPALEQNIIQYMENKIVDLEESISGARDLISVACFSENVDSVLMWAHYADSHRGFCIEYDTSRILKPYNSLLFPVYYTDERYDSTDDVIKRNENTILNPNFFKSKVWSYEKEWRIALTYDLISKNDRKANFSNAITGVYLGVQSEKEYSQNLLRIKSWANSKSIGCYQMKINPKGYNIFPENI